MFRDTILKTSDRKIIEFINPIKQQLDIQAKQKETHKARTCSSDPLRLLLNEVRYSLSCYTGKK